MVTVAIGNLSAQEELKKEESTCINCHAELEDELLEPVTRFRHDIHYEKGIACDGCHGGDSSAEDADESMDPDKGFIGVPDPLEIPSFCGKCHSSSTYMGKFNPALPVDQEKKYRTSLHGKRNAEGDRKVAQCASCHGIHGIRPAGDPLSKVHPLNVPEMCATCHSDPGYMKSYELPTDQYRKYAEGVHGVALLQNKETGAPACNDCHGNHGAVPPGVASIAFVCGNCHVNNMRLFNESPLKAAFSELHLPGCETCHNYHDIPKPTDAVVGVGPESVCRDCHTETKRPAGYRVAKEIRKHLDTLAERTRSADSVVVEASQRGMDVLDAEYRLKDVRQALIEARTMVHSFDAGMVKDKVDAGLEAAKEAVRLGEKAIANYYFRRKWLGFSTLILSFLVLMLIFKIREVDRRTGR
ncbi:MAG: hypothetical protein GTO09_10010 [Candidatus Latescibacteria bacterium]|nr:hypothetical protein [Candidatus Latescibacterota bacterium]